MNNVTTAHHTIVVKRTYSAPSARIFAAWRDPSALGKLPLVL